MSFDLPDAAIPRRALSIARRRMRAGRVLVVNGPRQSGKSALLGLLHQEVGGSYVSLDAKSNLHLARTDPGGFIASYDSPLFIDEVQRGGDPLILAVKYEIDRTQTKGRFALAGSTRFLTDPRITESLTGRVRFVDLWPLSQGEIDRTTDSFIDRAFQNSTGFLDERPTALSRLEIFERVVRGGFPESVLSESPVDRSEFFADYVRTITTRDVRELADLEHTARFRQIVRLVAARTATELNYSDIARTLDMSVATMRRYLPLFETVYLHHTLPSWSRNLSTKVVHRSKIHMVDSGIASHLLGFDAKGMNRSPAAAVGQLFESFVAAELAKQLTWSDTQASLYHWRARTGQEVDLLLESLQGQVVGIEVKTTVDLDESDFNGLKTLRDRIGADFVGGILIHCGDRPRTFGDRLFSVPASALWE